MSIYSVMEIIEVKKKSNDMLEINILRNSLRNILGVLKGVLGGLDVKMTPRRPAG